MRALIVAVLGLTILQQANHIGGPPATSQGGLALTADREGQAILLRWNPSAAPLRDASQATLIIIDGTHTSHLQLDPAELRSGVARYWPDSHSVEFRLETDRGVSGRLEATAPNPVPKPPASAAAKRPVVTGAAARRRTQPGIDKAALRRDKTSDPSPRPSRWKRLADKIPWWRKLPADAH